MTAERKARRAQAARRPPQGELICVLNERERELLAPEFAAIAEAERQMEAARQMGAGAQNAIRRMIKLRAGRDDVALDLSTWELRVHTPSPAAASGG